MIRVPRKNSEDAVGVRASVCYDPFGLTRYRDVATLLNVIFKENLVGGFTAGLVLGCLLGGGATFLSLLYATSFSDSRAAKSRLKSLFGMFLSIIFVSGIALFCHRLSIGRDASMLLLLFAVLAISHLKGAVTAFAATALAALFLMIWFFPAIGNLKMNDRLALFLFLFNSTIGIQLIRWRKPKRSLVNSAALSNADAPLRL